MISILIGHKSVVFLGGLRAQDEICMLSFAILGVAAAFAFAGWMGWTHFVGAIWSPAEMEVVKKMLGMARVGRNDVVYDLGAGDGRIVIEAARRGASAVGVEIDPLRAVMAWLLVLISGKSRSAKIKWGNLFNSDLHEATVVTLFLMQDTNAMLRDRLMDLPAGTRVVSHLWTFKDWTPTKVDKESMIYLYETGKGDQRTGKRIRLRI